MRAAGPLVRIGAPAGGPVWVVTDADLARRVLTDPRFAKDPALAPPGWDRRSAGLEPTAAEQRSLTTSDGPPHEALRATFAPLFSAQKMRSGRDRMLAIARGLLADIATQPVDLVADFSTRYPLTVLCDLLGIPAVRVESREHRRRHASCVGRGARRFHAQIPHALPRCRDSRLRGPGARRPRGRGRRIRDHL